MAVLDLVRSIVSPWTGRRGGSTTGILLALSALLACGLSSTQDAMAGDLPALNKGPTIRLDNRRWDFGVLPQLTDVEHNLRVTNVGTADLRILSIEPDCGCTVALAEDSTLTPGETTTILLTFSTRHYEGFQQKIVTLTTNDPAEPRIDLVFTADVRPYVQVGTRNLDFGKVQRGEGAAVTSVISADSVPEFKVQLPKGAEKWVSWKVKPGTPSPGSVSYVVEATLRPDAPYGAFNEKVEVALKHPKATSERIFVRGFVYHYFLTDFGTDKSRLEFPGLKAGKTATRTVKINADGSKPYRITGARAASSCVKATLEERGSSYLLSVTVVGEAGPKKIDEDVILTTTDPDQPEIHIPIIGRFL